MDEQRTNAIDRCIRKLTSAIPLHLFLDHLVLNGIFSLAETQVVQKGATDQMALIKTFEWLKFKEGGWESLIEYLRANRYGQLAKDLETLANPPDPNDSSSVGKRQIEFAKSSTTTVLSTATLGVEEVSPQQSNNSSGSRQTDSAEKQFESDKRGVEGKIGTLGISEKLRLASEHNSDDSESDESTKAKCGSVASAEMISPTLTVNSSKFPYVAEWLDGLSSPTSEYFDEMLETLAAAEADLSDVDTTVVQQANLTKTGTASMKKVGQLTVSSKSSDVDRRSDLLENPLSESEVVQTANLTKVYSVDQQLELVKVVVAADLDLTIVSSLGTSLRNLAPYLEDSQTDVVDTELSNRQTSSRATCPTRLITDSKAEKSTSLAISAESEETDSSYSLVVQKLQLTASISEVDKVDTASPTEVLPNIIKLMGNQVENIQVQMYCHRLIVQYSSDQLSRLAPSLRRSLIEVLLSVIKFHWQNNVFIDQFGDLMVKFGIHQSEVDLYLDMIDYLLDKYCLNADKNDLVTPARESLDCSEKRVLILLGNIAYDCDLDQRNSMGEKMFLQKICQSIRRQLLNKYEYDETMENSWNCIYHISRESVANQKRFLDSGGISLFQQCYKKFNNETKFVYSMTCLIVKCGKPATYQCEYFNSIVQLKATMSDEESFLRRLMANENLFTLWEIWSESKHNLISSICSPMFSNFLSDSPVNWPLGIPTIQEVKKKLEEEDRRARLQVDPIVEQTGADMVKVLKMLEGKSASLVANDQTDSSASHKTSLSEAAVDGDDVALSISTLSSRFNKWAPSEFLPDVIGLMRNQMGNVQVQMSCLRLIDQYSWDQLKLLASPSRSNLVQIELISVVKFYCNDSLVVGGFCDLLRKIAFRRVWYGTTSVCQGEVEWYMEAIDFLLEIIFDENNLTTTARKSALTLLRDVATESDLNQRNLIGENMFVEICRSITLKLVKCEFDEIMVLNWDCLGWICSYSVANKKRFLDSGGITLFQQCYKKFKHQTNLVFIITELLWTLSGEESCKEDLMAVKNLATLWEIWTGSRHDRTKSKCSQIFTNFLTVSPANWPSGHPTIEEVKKKLKEEKKCLLM